MTKRRFGQGKFNETHKIGFSKFLNLPLETSEKVFEFLFSTITCDLQSLCEKSSKKDLYKEIGYVANRLHVYFKEFALDASKFFPFKQLPLIIRKRCQNSMLPKLSVDMQKQNSVLIDSVESLCQLYASGKANIGKGGDSSIGTSLKTIFANYIEDDELLKELNALFLASTDAPT